MYKKFLLSVCSILIIGTSILAQDIDSKLDDIKTDMINSNFETSLTECKALLELNISDTTQLASLYSFAGLSSEVLGLKTEAIRYYQKAVELKIPQLDVYDKLINLSKKEKNDSIYEFALLEKLKAFPEYNQEIAKSLAYHYVNTQQYEKLFSTTGELLTWYPDEIKYLYFKAIALQNLNQAEEAKSYYNKVLELEPDHPGSNMSLGIILYNDGGEIFTQEKKKYESIAKPDRVDYAVYNRGLEKGKNLYQQAEPYLLNAYKSGSYPSLKRVLFNLYVRLEEKEKAEPFR